MKQNTKKTIGIAILLVLIIAGIIVTAISGFNKELKYQQTQSIDVYIEQQFDNNKIQEIANQVFGSENMIETVEVYKDMVTVRAVTITEEQKNEFVNKIKENYEFKQTAEETEIENIATTRIRDMYSAYILPFVISGILVLVYMVIRYNKIGILKVATKTILTPVIGELVLLSIIAITRIPLSRFTPVLLIAVYIFTIMYVVNKFEKDRKQLSIEEDKSN